MIIYDAGWAACAAASVSLPTLTSCNLELLGSFSSSYKPVAHCVPWLGLGTHPPELHLTTPHYGSRIGCGVSRLWKFHKKQQRYF